MAVEVDYLIAVNTGQQVKDNGFPSFQLSGKNPFKTPWVVVACFI